MGELVGFKRLAFKWHNEDHGGNGLLRQEWFTEARRVY